MEKKLSSKQLLRNLLIAARDPFSSDEKITDIQNILATSNSFDGVNHLILVKTYLNPTLFPFMVTKEEAFNQASLALKERNNVAYYYLYLLYKEDNELEKARHSLNAAATYQVVEALLEIARLKKEGIIYEKNIDSAISYYKEACKLNSREAYYSLQLLYNELGQYDKAEEIYKEAKEKGIQLLGTVS